jgi:hypothetical protein
MTSQELVNFWKQGLESEKIQLDNLDWAKLVFNEQGDVVVENENGTQFPVSDLSENEIDIFYANI